VVPKAGLVAAKAEAGHLLASLEGIGQAQPAIRLVAVAEMLRQRAEQERSNNVATEKLSCFGIFIPTSDNSV
jgi:hypothetical protein